MKKLVLVVVLGVLVQADHTRPKADAIVVFAPEHEVVHLSQTGDGAFEIRGPFGTRTLPGGGSLAVTVTGGGTLEVGSLSWAGALELSAHRLTVTGRVNAKRARFSAGEMLYVEPSAELAAAMVELNAEVVANIGTVHADGRIAITGEHVMNQGVLHAPGGEVSITFGSHYLESRRGAIDVSSSENGGAIRVAGRQGSHLFSSGRHRAQGRRGGSIALDAGAVELAGASLDASGAEGGGHIDIGGDTRRLAVRGGTLVADGTEAGSGGRIVLASLDATVFGGHASSRGGRLAGDGGFIDVSSAGEVAFGGAIATDAPMGHAGKLVLDPKNITIGDQGDLLSIELVDPSPFAGDLFGDSTMSLASGNIVVTDALDDFAATDAGAVHLYSGQDGALLATLIGSSADDAVGSGVTPLSNGNYVVTSPDWSNGGASEAGAVTWGDGVTGIAGAVSGANSLVGTTASDSLELGVTALTNGNYVVKRPFWDNGGVVNAGAVTWGDGTTGIAGTVSDINSLVGTTPGDAVGVGGVTALSNGNYVVPSRLWDNGLTVDAGAATWGDGASGIAGAVTAANSLVGTTANDRIGVGGVTALTNGHYVVSSGDWDSGGAANAGAATWGDGTTGIAGAVTAANSLVGTTAFDNVGYGGVTALSNGNYVVRSPAWRNGALQAAGAATWGNGTTGIAGAVSATNSLVGATAFDNVGAGVRALPNGNYLAITVAWSGGGTANAGAVTWGDGTSGIVGAVSATNSLVGTTVGDSVGNGTVTVLSNGNYVIISGFWDNGAEVNAGAVTWGDGTSAIVGAISAANSLVGTTANDSASTTVTTLSSGNYVVRSMGWDNGGAVDAGAVTWGDGTTGVSGVVSVGNSLVGTTAGDIVGSNSVVALSNGNYVVASPWWDNGGLAEAGAATWGDGASGIAGEISGANSLVGSTAGDGVGDDVAALSNGNYVVTSPSWDNGATANVGAATWGNGTTGIAGTISVGNSLVGATANNEVGSSGADALSNGNYVVKSPEWDNAGAVDAGAATWGDGASGITGAVSSANSLVGSTAGDSVGYDDVTVLSNGSYVVPSAEWDDGAIADVGALTVGSGTTGVSGVVSPANSVIGPVPGGGAYCYASESAPNRFIGTFPNAASVHLVIVGLDLETVQPSYGFLASRTVTIAPEAITSVLQEGSDVVLEASNDLVVDAELLTDNPGGDGGSLTLSAGRQIQLNANIVTDGGDLTLVANDVLASGVVDVERDEGDGGIAWASGITVDTGSGALALHVRDGAGKTFPESGELELGEATADTVLAQVQGASLLLQGAVQATGAGDGIVLVTDTAFAAETGSLDTPNGRFLVYAPTPEAVAPGVLVFSFEEYGKTYPDAPEPEHDGSGILYAVPDPGAGGGGAGEGGEGGAGGGGEPAPPPEDDGCSCRTAGGAPGSALGAWLLAPLLLLSRRGRRW